MASSADVFNNASRMMLDQHLGDERGRMLHAPALKTAGKFYAFATSDGLVVKLPAPRVAELIATGAGRPCDPLHGRPMKQWVRLQPSDQQTCIPYLMEARDFVAKLPNR